ncbi:peptidase inhibitor family I36 protein [Kitasatospora sp. NPDC036755]|uniref:peptidase inhibitor family I36 protein n=1 Tax=Kitasatospora sp. NPDC036755 TaxID=3154600 RepID=UPI0033FC4FBD
MVAYQIGEPVQGGTRQRQSGDDARDRMYAVGYRVLKPVLYVASTERTKRMGMRIAGTLISFATAIAFMSAAPSQATPLDYNDCPQGRFCIWHDENGQGARLSFAVEARDLNELAGGLNDHVLSAWNRTTDTWCIYADANYNGDFREVPHEPLKGSIGNLGQFGYQVSSLQSQPWYGC